jgi:hypothetical protein
MNYLTSKNRKELFLIIILIPVIGSLISKALNIHYINWISFAHLTALIWQFETILKLNRTLKGEFSLTLTKIGFSIWIPLLLISLYNFKPETIFNLMNGAFSFVFVIIGMVVNLTYFYVIYILTRMHSRVTTGHDLSGLELFPTYFYFLIYPIGIWKYQNELREMENETSTQHDL